MSVRRCSVTHVAHLTLSYAHSSRFHPLISRPCFPYHRFTVRCSSYERTSFIHGAPRARPVGMRGLLRAGSAHCAGVHRFSPPRADREAFSSSSLLLPARCHSPCLIFLTNSNGPSWSPAERLPLPQPRGPPGLPRSPSGWPPVVSTALVS